MYKYKEISVIIILCLRVNPTLFALLINCIVRLLFFFAITVVQVLNWKKKRKTIYSQHNVHLTLSRIKTFNGKTLILNSPLDFQMASKWRFCPPYLSSTTMNLKELGTSRTHSAVIRCLTICQHIPVVRKNHKNQLTQQFDIICCLARCLALCIESKQIM